MNPFDAILSPVSRAGAAAQNALEVARFGGLETGEEASPFEVVAKRPIYRLRRYFPPEKGEDVGPPVILVPPMMLASEIYDVSPSSTAVGTLHAQGVDPWVVDFGAPEHEEGGFERTLADHVLAVSDAVDLVRKATGKDPHLGGYSQGGMFCYQAAALRRGEGLASLITFGSPVDTAAAMPLGIPEGVATRLADVLAVSPLARGAVPAWMSRTGFRMLDPVKAARQQLDFVRQLHDRDALLPRERQRQFLQADGWVAWPGPALADFLKQFVAHNRMLDGGFVIDERLVTLADIECPILTVVGEVDEIAPAAAVRAIVRAAPRAEVYELALRAGHFGLVVGSVSTSTTWPSVAGWTRWRDADAELPDTIRRVEESAELESAGAGATARAGYGLSLAGGVASNLARSFISGAARTASGVRTIGSEAFSELPRLIRLDQVRPRTRISLGKLLDEQADDHPEQVFFLFEDRAHTHAAAKHRIDSIVRGLISLGVHQGEHVGVLMEPRPTALTVVAALNRLGAVGVLLRPDGDVEREAELGEIGRVVSDPEHMDEAIKAGVQVLVLGGGAGPRDLGRGVVDMERIDPDKVKIPGWYKPNPGRARDLAFILFTGSGDRTRPNRITNRRWILSAFGTAASASLSESDTVYSVTPVYHPSGLMVSLGGAIAGGARIAMARDFDPATFWDEVRRYGVTVGSYTWTMLRDLVEAEPNPNERHHPVRLFMGSGMPQGLWTRVVDRFAPARIVEFYASTQGEVVLANVSGQKIGAMGRPLPGSARVRIAALDLDAGKLKSTDDGFARECDTNEIGVLVSEVDPDVNPTAETPLRGVFRPDDAWVATGDLFRKDADGDFWLLDSITTLIRTEDGPFAPTPVRDALWSIDAVDIAVCFGVPDPDGPEALVVGAVTLRKGQKLTIADLEDALSALPEKARPHFVRVVDEIPVTTWYRPITAPIKELGVPDGKKGVAYKLNSEGGYNKVAKPKPKPKPSQSPSPRRKQVPEFETVNLEVADGVATVELNRPEALNAWNFQLGADLRDALESVAGDDAVRAVLLTGAGRAFSSGADLAETRENTDDSLDAEGNFDLSKRLRERYHPIIHAIRDMPKPVVSAVNGPAAGIGCSLALSADLIVAGHSSFFLLAFVNIGLVPDGGSSAFVPARIGLARAAEMMMLGERVSSAKALEWGLVNKVVPDESLHSESRALVERLAKGPTRSYAGSKALLNRRVYADLEGQLEAEADQQRDMGKSQDFIEGVMAFAQKREPEFKGS